MTQMETNQILLKVSILFSIVTVILIIINRKKLPLGIRSLFLFSIVSLSLTSASEFLLNKNIYSHMICFIPYFGLLFPTTFAFFLYSFILRKSIITMNNSEKKFRLLVENMPGIVYILEAKEPYPAIYISENVESITALKKKDFHQKKALWDSLIENRFKDSLRECYKKVINENEKCEFEYKIDLPVGKRWFRDRMSPMKLDGKKYVMGISFDITEMKENENKLKESEERYRLLAENATDLIIFMDLRGKIQYVNKAVLELTGEKLEKILGSYIEEYIPEEEFSAFKKRQNLRLAGNLETFSYETKLKLNEKEYVFDVVSTPVIKDGKVEGLLVIGRNITEKKKAEERNSILAEVIKQAASSIVITDTDGNIEYVNPFFEKVTGYSYEEVKGQNPRILKSGKHNEEFYKNLWDTITSGRTWHDIFINKKKDGSLYYEDAIIFPIKDKNGKIIRYAGVKQDITKQIEYEKQVVQLQRLDAIGKFTTGIAHDFNNILTTIIGYSEVLEKLTKDDPEIKKKVNLLKKAGERAKNLISSLLAFSRKQMRKREVLNINELIEDMYDMFKRMIPEDIIFKLELSPHAPSIYADRVQIEQILINFLINSKEAIEEAGKSEKIIKIRTERVFIDDTFTSKHPGSKKGEYLLLEVYDNGKGMSEEVKKKIFEPFFSTKKGGTGLGLSTIFGIVKQNDGYITVYSEEGKGTTFKIYWPKTFYKEKKQGISIDRKEEKEFKVSGNVLVVDDNEDVRSVMREFAENIGLQVEEAVDGREAFEKIKKTPNKYKLVVSDIVMPEIDGFELKELLNQEGINIKMIFCSGYPLKHVNDFSLEEEKNLKFLSKPVSFNQFVEAIKELLSEEK